MVLRLSVVLSAVALLVLAGLQYNWIGQIAVAERQRLQMSVAESSQDFSEDFTTELRTLVAMIEPRQGGPSGPEAVAARYQEWAGSAAYPGLVKSLYIAHFPQEILRLDATKGVFVPDSWPAYLPPMDSFVSGRGREPLEIERDVLLIRMGRRFPGGRGGRGQRGGGFSPEEFSRRGGEPGPPPPPRIPGDGGQQPQRDPPDDEGWILAELNRDVLTTQILPALVTLRFPDYEGRDYRVAVVSLRQGSNPRVVFSSGDPWTDRDIETPDYQTNLFGGPPPRDAFRGERGPRGPDPRGPAVILAGQRWQLLVKHRAGSVETAATRFKNRNLAISAGVLIVLGIGTAVMLISGSRAHRLGKLQMEFAAGISHELRTPLAVIQSAAHNLGSGVVQDREGIAEYAAIVQTEARRLTEMVEQVRTYTETQSGRKRYDLAPVDADDVVDLAVRHMTLVLREGTATLEKRLDPGLPPVIADASALTRCLQNLLSNAVKYGRNNTAAQVEIEGSFVAVPGGPGKVQLSVVDHGSGVPEADVNHLFEAFHRGSNASTNTPGNGLGLHLVRRIMEAMNGSVTYVRKPDGGAKFTLTLPAAGGPA